MGNSTRRMDAESNRREWGCEHGSVAEQTTQTGPLTDLDPERLAAFRDEQQAAYDALRERGLALDLTRGKPSPAQLDLSDRLLTLPDGTRDPAGVDVRNYGGLEGIRRIREMFADLLWVEPEQVVAGGNSSLVLMREVLTDLWLKGGVDSERPWSAEEKVTFICPVPGYDRHFTLLSWFGIETVTVPMHDDGPDADAVAELVAKDPSIKGMWVVPTYANPTGSIVSQEVAARLASMPTAAPDFKIFWDNAYAFHHLTEDEAKSADVLSLAAASGPPAPADHVRLDLQDHLRRCGRRVPRRVGRDGARGTSATSARARSDRTSSTSCGTCSSSAARRACATTCACTARSSPRSSRPSPRSSRSGSGAAAWRPGPTRSGGYFVSLDVLPGTAARVIELAKAAGVALTPAGSAFPDSHDPDDTNIRLAPTFPQLAEVREAMEAVATCVLLAAAEKLAGLTLNRDAARRFP